MPGFASRRGTGGGVERVRELPDVRKGLGNIYYLVETYNENTLGPYRASDFDLALSAASFLPAGTTNIGFASDARLGSLNAPGVAQLQTGDGTGRANLIISDGADDALGNPNAIRAVLAGNEVVQLGRDNFDPPGVFAEGYVNFSARGIPAAAEFTAGQDYTVRLTTADQQTGFTPEGVRSIGDPGSPRNVTSTEVREAGFWHVDPDTMEWRRGFGGDAGGIPGAILPEAGLTDAFKRDEVWRGILIGLARDEAGIDWALETVAGQDAVQATAQFEHLTGGGAVAARLTATIAAATARGEAGNDWTLSVSRAAQNSAGANAGSRTILLRVAAGATYSDAAAVLRAIPQVASTGIAADGTLAIPDSALGQYNFTGGLDPAELGVEVDDVAKTVRLEHLATHTQAEIVEFLNDNEVDEDTTLYAVLANGSTPGSSPEAAPQTIPFSRIFSTGSLPRPSNDDIAAIRQEIAALTFADIGGQIADGQVPAGFTRDAELTKTFLLGILGLSAQELDDLFVGAQVSGSGAGRIITVTQADGSTITLAVPDVAGGGGGGGSADGVVSSAEFAADGTTLTLTLSTGGTVTANVPEALRQAGLSQSQVQALIDAAEADDVSAADVAAQIAASVDSGRAAYAGPFSLAGYTRQAQSNANPSVGSYRSRVGTANQRGYTINLRPEDAHVGPYLAQFVDSTITIDGTDGTAETAGGAAGTISAVQQVSGNIYLVTIDSAAGFSASGVESTTGTWAIQSAVSRRIRVWGNIPANTPIAHPTIVYHAPAGGYFGTLQAHNRGSIGPDGDTDNFIALASLAQVTSYAANTIVRPWRRGWTFRATGDTTRLLSLPNASGADEVPNGWDCVAMNDSTANQTVQPNGADTIDGIANLTLAPSRTVRLQKVATGIWRIIADTKDESGGADLPNVVNVAVDTAIPATAFGDTYRVTGNVSRTLTLPDPDDVATGWFVRVANGSAATGHNVAREGAGQSIEGGNGPLAVPAGQSVTIQKVNTNEWELIADTAKAAASTGGALSLSTPLTDAQKKAWRAHFGAWHLSFLDNSTLPAIANYNGPDGVILGATGDTSVSFRDIADLATPITDGVAGDLMILLARGWTRVTNLFQGAAVKAMAEANAAVVGRLPIFGRISVNPGGIPDAVPPRFITLTLDSKLTDRTIRRILCSIEGQNFADITRDANPVPPATDPAAPFNLEFNAGGVINGSFTAAQLDNLATQAGLATSRAAQALQGQIRYSFTEGADAIDYFEWGVQNNGFRPLVVDNITHYDAAAHRFEDASNNRVWIPEGAQVYTTQAIYAAAVADAANFALPAGATFFTRA